MISYHGMLPLIQQPINTISLQPVLYVAENKKPAPISQPADGETFTVMCNFWTRNWSHITVHLVVIVVLLLCLLICLVSDALQEVPGLHRITSDREKILQDCSSIYYVSVGGIFYCWLFVIQIMHFPGQVLGT